MNQWEIINGWLRCGPIRVRLAAVEAIELRNCRVMLRHVGDTVSIDCADSDTAAQLMAVLDAHYGQS